ncbi:MAG: hypothetical protein DLM55_01585 [Acidimicrobiales bacterium]|nr:MAG: hypothetical protein DLM55_01585 [Acidimicrobiales bacterium]
MRQQLTDADRERIEAIRAEVAEEEAEAAEAEAAEAAEADKAVISVRVPTYLADRIKARAVAEHIPASALVRRILSQATDGPTAAVLSVQQVENIARRVHQELAEQSRAA